VLQSVLRGRLVLDVDVTVAVITVLRATTWVARVSVHLGGEAWPVIVRVLVATTASSVN